MMRLTERQQKCLDFLRSYHAEKGVMPTLREIGDGCGLRSKSNVHRTLDRLVERGHIRRAPGKARSIEIVTPETVKLSDEVFRLVQAYADSQHITVDCAASEILREVLETA